MQRLGGDRLTVEIFAHQVFIDLHDLVDDFRMGVGQGENVGISVFVKETVANRRKVLCRQVDRQAFGAKFFADLAHQCLEIDFLGVDAVDDHHAAKPALTGAAHQPARGHFDAGSGIDDDGGGFDCAHGRKRLPAKIGVAGGIDQLYFGLAGIKVHDRAV